MSSAIAHQPSHKNTILVTGTGGTIAGLSHHAGNDVAYTAGQLGIDKLLQRLDAWRTPSIQCAWVSQQIANIDSKDLTHHLWRTLVRHLHQHAQHHQAHVVTHGTDSLEETALLLWRLQELWPIPRPLVLTAAMRPADAIDADGPAHLLHSLILAEHLVQEPIKPATWVCLQGQIWRGCDIQKVAPYSPPAFASAEMGPWGKIENGTVRWLLDPNLACSVPNNKHTEPSSVQQGAQLWLSNCLEHAAESPQALSWPWVEIITATANAHSALIPALIHAGIQGLVLAGMGNAQVPEIWKNQLQTQHHNSPLIWMHSRCHRGQTVPTRELPHTPETHALSLAQVKLDMCLTLLAYSTQHIQCSGA